LSFFDEYKDIGAIGGDYLTAAEKQVIIDEGIPFEITDILDDDESQYGARFVCVVNVPDPESGDEASRKWSFTKSTVESRDRMLVQMQEYLKQDDSQPVLVKVEKVGRSNIIRQA